MDFKIAIKVLNIEYVSPLPKDINIMAKLNNRGNTGNANLNTQVALHYLHGIFFQ